MVDLDGAATFVEVETESFVPPGGGSGSDAGGLVMLGMSSFDAIIALEIFSQIRG